MTDEERFEKWCTITVPTLRDFAECAFYAGLADERARHADWKPGRWWRVFTSDGTLYCETSDEEEARCAARRIGEPLQRLWVRTDKEWRLDDTEGA